MCELNCNLFNAIKLTVVYRKYTMYTCIASEGFPPALNIVKNKLVVVGAINKVIVSCT